MALAELGDTPHPLSILSASNQGALSLGSSEEPQTGGLKGHSPSLAFLVDFANILLWETILLGDLEGNSRVSLPAAITGFIQTF